MWVMFNPFASGDTLLCDGIYEHAKHKPRTEETFVKTFHRF